MVKTFLYQFLAFFVSLAPVVSSLDLKEREVSLRGHGSRNLQVAQDAAIITVIDSYTKLSELCYTFQTLVRAKGSPDAPVVAFHGIPLLDGQKETLKGCTSRSLSFEDITDFYASFPDGYVPTASNYDYQQTQRFITTWIWDHPALSDFDIIMRISDSTCLTKDNYDLPGFIDQSESLVYETMSSPGSVESAHKYTTNLYDAAFNHFSQHGHSPNNPEMWARVATVKSGFDSLPKFDSEFEIIRKSFMQQAEVKGFHYALTENQDEIFDWNWSSSTIRFLTLAIYGQYYQISINSVSGFVGKDFFRGNLFPQICRDISQVS